MLKQSKMTVMSYKAKNGCLKIHNKKIMSKSKEH